MKHTMKPRILIKGSLNSLKGKEMIFHTFGDKNKRAVLFIHGMLLPWQIWSRAIEYFSKDYYVIVPELDAHTQDETSQFNSVEEEALKIEKYILENLNGKTYMICGLSMGGAIAAKLIMNGNIVTEKLILDGAPLLKVSGLLKKIMKSSYISIIKKTKKRDPKVIERAKRDFLPGERMDDFFKLADRMENDSLVNMIDTIFAGTDIKKIKNEPGILFLHGTKGNEAVSKKAAIKLKEENPQTQIMQFDGYAHAQLAVFESDKWVDAVSEWINNKEASYSV